MNIFDYLLHIIVKNKSRILSAVSLGFLLCSMYGGQAGILFLLCINEMKSSILKSHYWFLVTNYLTAEMSSMVLIPLKALTNLEIC